MTTIRAMLPEDRAFVRSGWSSSMRGTHDLALIPMRNYPAIVHPIIDSILDHSSVTTLVAHGDNGVLQGFVVADPTPYGRHVHGRAQRGLAGARVIPELVGYVYYLYVAAPFRGWQIAAGLLAAAGIERAGPFGYAIRTRSSFEARSKIPLAVYDPFRARFLTSEPQPHEQRSDSQQ